MVVRLGIITAGRSDWGHLEGLVAALSQVMDVVVIGSRGAGMDVGAEISYFALRYQSAARLDAVLIFGDRWEQMAAAIATITKNLPVIHLHAGEWTPHAFDNQCRRVISSLAHLFLVAHGLHRTRLLGMGIPAHRIHVTGAPGLDRFLLPAASREAVAEALGLDLARDWALVMLHPTTFRPEDAEQELADALVAVGHRQAIWLTPGNDPGGEWFRERMVNPIEAIPDDLYRSLIRHVDVVIGNSSAVVVDAPFVGVKTVEIGLRQAGRNRVPYGDGYSIPRIVNILQGIDFRPLLCEAS